MGYKLKRIMMWVNGVEKQIRPTGWQPGANTIAYYAFDGNLNDGGNNGYNLTATSSSFSYNTGISGQCITKNIEGLSFYSTSLRTSMFSGNFTIMFFLNISSVHSVDRLLGGYGTDYFNIQYESGEGGLQIYNNGERTSWTWSPVENEWHHIAITGDGSVYTAYLDGVLMNKIQQGGTNPGDLPMAIGTNSTSNTDTLGFLGSIDEVIFENKTWTQHEIQNYLSNFTY